MRRIASDGPIAATLGGVLHMGAYLHPAMTWLAWLALLPLFEIASSRARLWRKAVYCTGMIIPTGALGLSVLFWDSRWIKVDGWSLALSVVASLAIYSAFWFAFAIIGGFLLRQSPGYGLVLLPILWAGLETLRVAAHAVTPLAGPWYLLGYSQAVPGNPFSQVADCLGAYGVSAVVVAVNLIVWSLLVRRRVNWQVVALASAVALSLAYGYLRPKLLAQVPVCRVGIVQVAAPAVRVGYSSFGGFLERFRLLTRRAAAEGADLVLWPEAAIPYPVRFYQPAREWVEETRRRAGIPIIFGTSDYEQHEANHWEPFEAVFVSDDRGTPSSVRYKTLFTPLGESDRFVAVPQLGGDSNETHRAETEERPLHVGGVKPGVAICFEALFAGFVRRTATNGAQFLLNPGDESCFGGGPGIDQSLRHVFLRAIENREWVCRSTNRGRSCFITPTGRIVGAIPPNEGGVQVQMITMPRSRTFFTVYGDLFGWACVLAILLALLPRALQGALSSRHTAVLLLAGLVLPTWQESTYAGETIHPLLGKGRVESSVEKLMVVCDEASRDAARLALLRDEGLASEVDLSKARAADKLARIELREALRNGIYARLQVLLDDVRLSADGTVRVRMRAMHTGQLGAIPYRRALKLAGLGREAAWKPGGIVSIRNGRRIVGRPFTKWIAFEPDGGPVETAFELEGEPAEVTIRLERDALVREWTVSLLSSTSANEFDLDLTSEHPAQEGFLGNKVVFPLKIRRRNSAAASYELRAASSPAGVHAYFSEGNTRLAGIRFEEGELSKQAELNVTLPQRATSEIKPGSEIAITVTAEGMGTTRKHGNGVAGRINFGLMPRGLGELEVLAENQFAEVESGGKAVGNIMVCNRGSGLLSDIEIHGVKSYGWSVAVEPRRIAVLRPDEEAQVSLSFQPPGDAIVGEQEFDIEISGQSTQGSIEKRSKRFTVRLRKRVDYRVVMLFLAVFAVIAAALAWLAYRVSRTGA